MNASAPRLLAAFVTAATLALPTVANADQVVAQVNDDTPISAYAGKLAWSDYNVKTKRYRLMISDRLTPGSMGVVETTAANVPTARRPFDVSLTRTSSNRFFVLYTRCTKVVRGAGGLPREAGCDVYRYEIQARKETRLAAVSSPVQDEAWPVQAGDRVFFARRGRNGCDEFRVKSLTSSAASHEIARPACGTISGIAVDENFAVVTTDDSDTDFNLPGLVTRFSLAGPGKPADLARAGRGEGGYSPYSSPSIVNGSVYLARGGNREGVTNGFVRIQLRSRVITTVGRQTLAGRVAREDGNSTWFIQGTPDEEELPGMSAHCAPTQPPCQLVLASADPYPLVTALKRR